jgi:hypothetical protein
MHDGRKHSTFLKFEWWFCPQTWYQEEAVIICFLSFPITDAIVTGTVVIPSCIMADISVGQCTRCAMSGP